MIVKYKKTGEIQISVDLRKLNGASLCDSFSMPFTNDVIYGVEG